MNTRDVCFVGPPVMPVGHTGTGDRLCRVLDVPRHARGPGRACATNHWRRSHCRARRAARRCGEEEDGHIERLQRPPVQGLRLYSSLVKAAPLRRLTPVRQAVSICRGPPHGALFTILLCAPKVADEPVITVSAPAAEEGALRRFADHRSFAINRKWPIKTPSNPPSNFPGVARSCRRSPSADGMAERYPRVSPVTAPPRGIMGPSSGSLSGSSVDRVYFAVHALNKAPSTLLPQARGAGQTLAKMMQR